MTFEFLRLGLELGVGWGNGGMCEGVEERVK